MTSLRIAESLAKAVGDDVSEDVQGSEEIMKACLILHIIVSVAAGFREYQPLATGS